MRNELLEPLLEATEIGLGGEIGEGCGRQAGHHILRQRLANLPTEPSV